MHFEFPYVEVAFYIIQNHSSTKYCVAVKILNAAMYLIMAKLKAFQNHVSNQRSRGQKLKNIRKYLERTNRLKFLHEFFFYWKILKVMKLIIYEN